MDEILHRILSASDRVAVLSDRIEEHGNRLFGPQASPCENEAKKPEPQGSVEHLFDALAKLDDQISRAASAHVRISQV